MRLAASLGDLDGDGELTREEFMDAAKILVLDEENGLTGADFAFHDFDANGTIDYDELEDAKEGERSLEKYNPIRRVVNELFAEVDEDEDWLASMEEFVAAVEAMGDSVGLDLADFVDEERFAFYAGEDGTISRQEAVTFLNLVLIAQERRRAWTNYNKWFDYVDADHSQTVSAEEIMEGEQRARDIIAKVDQDGDGAITYSEIWDLETVFHMLDPECSGSVSVEDVRARAMAAHELIKLLDTDNDGSASYHDVENAVDALSEILDNIDVDANGMLSNAELYVGALL